MSVAQQPASPAVDEAQGEWYLVQTKPRQEDKAAENLQNQGFAVYSPKMQVSKLRNGREFSKQEPLFPNYIFILLRPGVDNWSPIRSTRGVLRMVVFGGKPRPVPNQIIATIQQKMEQKKDAADKALEEGDAVLITTGDDDAVDLEAVFSRYDGDERVIVLLNILQSTREVKVSMSHIKKRL